jgi:hypothetical protein
VGNVDEGPYEYLRSRRIKPAEINMITLCCQLFSPHLLYSLGAEIVWPQGGVGRNHQVTIAFTRGAARQYGKPWFYDMAPFDCQGNDIPMAYDDKRRRFSGFSEDFMLRSWMLGYLCGVKTFTFQAADMGFFIKEKNGSRSLSPIGEMARDFADFTLRNHPDRGEPVAPVAIMLSRDHGYTTTFRNSAMIFWKKLPNDPENNEVEAFFRLAFPGCHDTNGYSFDTDKWAPGGSCEKQNPWVKKDATSRQEYASNFRTAIRDGFDQRPIEKGFITASTWGDSFDVLVDNASAAALGKYRGIVLLGGLKLDGELREKLRAYVKNGGRLLVNVSSVSAEDEEFLGVKFLAGMGTSLYHSHSAITGRKFDEGYFKYARIVHTTAEALLYADIQWDKSNPIVTRNKYGKGEVWFTASPYNQAVDKYDLDMLESSKETFDEFFRPLIAVDIIGKPVHWLLNKTTDGVWLSMFNNTAEPWEGDALLKNVKGPVSVREIWTDKAANHILDSDGHIVLKVELPPWKFRIYEVRTVDAISKLRK